MSGIAAIVLAAGQSTRFGTRNKLLAAMPDGRPMIVHTVANTMASMAWPVIVVTGHEAEAVERTLTGLRPGFVRAADYSEGLSASLRAGVGAVPAAAEAVLIVLGDMPFVTAPVIDALCAAYLGRPGSDVVVPVHGGVRGNPRIWGRRHFAALRALTGDAGARGLAREVVEVPAPEMVLRDVDTDGREGQGLRP
jgi:molybdenum cofactor cytidylyltransferase